MSGISLVKDFDNFKKSCEFGVEDGLDFLCKYGKPRLAKTDNGWYVSIEMFVNGEGVNFKIDSDFGLKTQKEAVHQCIDRLLKTIKSLSK